MPVLSPPPPSTKSQKRFCSMFAEADFHLIQSNIQYHHIQQGNSYHLYLTVIPQACKDCKDASSSLPACAQLLTSDWQAVPSWSAPACATAIPNSFTNFPMHPQSHILFLDVNVCQGKHRWNGGVLSRRQTLGYAMWTV